MAKVEQKEEKNNKTIYNIGYKEQAIRREKNGNSNIELELQNYKFYRKNRKQNPVIKLNLFALI